MPAALSFVGRRWSGEVTPRTGSVGLVRPVLAPRSKLPASTTIGLIATSLGRLWPLGCAPATGVSFFCMALVRRASACSLHAAFSAADSLLTTTVSPLGYGFPQSLNSTDVSNTRPCVYFLRECRTCRALPFTSVSRSALPGILVIRRHR